MRANSDAASTTDAELLALAAPRPWYFDGWDVFTTGPTDDTGGHRLVFPLPHETFHPSQMVSKADAELAVRAVNAYEAMRAYEKLAHYFAEQLVELWHGDETVRPPVSLAEWMGLTDEQYAAWAECRWAEVLP